NSHRDDRADYARGSGAHRASAPPAEHTHHRPRRRHRGHVASPASVRARWLRRHRRARLRCVVALWQTRGPARRGAPPGDRAGRGCVLYAHRISLSVQPLVLIAIVVVSTLAALAATPRSAVVPRHGW